MSYRSNSRADNADNNASIESSNTAVLDIDKSLLPDIPEFKEANLFDSEQKAKADIVNRIHEISEKLIEEYNKGHFDYADKPVQDLLSKVETLEKFFNLADINFQKGLAKINEQTGLFAYFKYCVNNDLNPLLSVALKVIEANSASAEKHQGISMDNYDHTGSDPLLRTALNQLSVIAAQEIGLINLREADALLRVENTEKISSGVKKLNASLKKALRAISSSTITSKRNSSRLGVAGPDERLAELLSGKCFTRFSFKYKTLVGETALSRPLSFKSSHINWDRIDEPKSQDNHSDSHE